MHIFELGTHVLGAEAIAPGAPRWLIFAAVGSLAILALLGVIAAYLFSKFDDQVDEREGATFLYLFSLLLVALLERDTEKGNR